MCKTFSSFIYQIPLTQFSQFQRENILVGSEKKYSDITNFFHSPHSNQTPTKKNFPSHFLSKVFHLSYFISKQTHPQYAFGQSFFSLRLRLRLRFVFFGFFLEMCISDGIYKHLSLPKVSLKMDLIVLFTHLKIILLHYFQFSTK